MTNNRALAKNTDEDSHTEQVDYYSKYVNRSLDVYVEVVPKADLLTFYRRRDAFLRTIHSKRPLNNILVKIAVK